MIKVRAAVSRKIRSALVISAALTALSGCSIGLEDLGGRVQGHVWEEFASGEIGGADIARDLKFGSVSAQPEIDGAMNIWRNRLEVDWSKFDRTENGTARSNFQFAGQNVPFSSQITTHVNADVIRGTYGFVIGPKLFSATPLIGGAWIAQDTTVVGTGQPTILTGVPAAAVPVNGEAKDSQPFPVAGLRLESVPLSWLDFEGQVSGFGIPGGEIVDAKAMMGARYYHLRADAGYRYLRFDFGDTHIRIKGLMFGGGFYF